MSKPCPLTHLLHPSGKLCERICRERFTAYDHQRAVIDKTNSDQILFHVKWRFGEQRNVGGERQLIDKNRISVSGCAGDAASPDHAATPTNILDEDTLAERAPHVLSDQACRHIGASASRIGHDDGDISRREILRLRGARPYRKGGSGGSHFQKTTPQKFHSYTP